MTGLSSLPRRCRRAVLARRRPLAAVCAAVAVAAALRTTAAPPPPRSMVLTAARDVAAGEVLRSDDVTRSAYDPDSVPAGVLDEDAALGRTTTVPLRRGEPVTDVRLVTGSLLDDHPGLVAVPVRIGDAGAVALLHAGDRIDLVAADPQSDTGAQVVARDVPVLAIPQPRRETPGLTNGALVVLGLPDDTARTVAQASVAAFLSVVLKR